ncbi:MAG: PSD1 and planctomycete cytochrome C domain-containing protein [Bryobacteraceae bacterium]|nr:PSD1 and planctomycete cytochrome C domain-containing protein [Bryobacteraceae bacterium]
MRFFVALLLPMLCMAQRRDPLEFFETKVRPVLAKHCFSCHTQTKLGGLEMSSRDTLLKGGKSGAAINLEAPEESLLVKAVRHTHEKLKMPPTGDKLGAQEIKDLVAWIGRGAVWPATGAKAASTFQIKEEHRNWWAFRPVARPQPPAVNGKAWARTAIDRFIMEKLEAKGLKPVAAAPKREWIRRVTFDLTGLPATVEEVDAFVGDTSAEAQARVVDRLLASKHFGERWGRHWLDVARYSDDLLNSTQDQPYENAFRYRDWVIEAFNSDMPYDVFVKAQLAGDLMEDSKAMVGGLGFYALSPQFQDDRVDVTTKAFLGMTVACAQCHDHKFDPIPTKDYYSLLGVFSSSENTEFPLAPEPQVREYRDRKKAVDEQEARLNKYLEDQAKQLAEILANQAADYLRASRKVIGGKADGKQTASQMNLDAETLGRWTKYLSGKFDHPYLKDWEDEAKFPAEHFQKQLLDLWNEQKEIENQNFIRLGGSNERGNLASADLLSLPRDKYILFRDVFSDRGILYYKAPAIERFLDGPWKSHLVALRAELDRRKKAMPEQYPFLHVIKDRAKPRNERVRIRGSAENLGEEAPRHFLTILCDGEPAPFSKGSGRLELAEAITSPTNPLTARVMANRVWHHLFGQGLVRTLVNFGQLGEKPSHAELLDHLARRLVEQKWSLKSLIREIVLTNTYGLSHQNDEKNFTVDPDNRLLWRSARRRLDMESMRDTLLAATGELDPTAGGKPQKLTEEKNLRRTVYGFVSRRKLDGTLALFDFPNPNSMSEQRVETSTPLQQLYFLNSRFVQDRAGALAAKLEREATGDAARIKRAYRILFYRDPSKEELESGLAYLKSGNQAWPRYAQVLLGSNEFLYY